MVCDSPGVALSMLKAMTACPACGADAPPGSRFCPACGRGIIGTDRQRAERELRAAVDVFERLGSVREEEQARTLLAAGAV